MAMLAGPRRKQKVINLRAKNSEWSNDANKFGQRMLEKMGWSSGKGLGANENGMVDHVIARYKNDEKGLGYEDKNDQWTKHEDDFNALLANLSNGDKDEIKLHSGVSLEVKSKKSKARVHYHKFTRGKDLTRYSEKDLANIFGKKTLKNKKNYEPTIVQEKTIKEEVKSEQVFKEKGSMEDYFKNKLAALKSKNISLSYEKEDYEDDYGFQGFLGAAESKDQQNVGFQGFSFCNNSKDSEHSNELVTAEPELRKTKKNKKSKKKNNDAEIQDNENTVELAENHSFENMEDEPQPAKKKKSKKNKDKSETIHEEKIKNKKYKIEPTAEEVPEEDCHIPKKKKKRKNKDDQ